MAGRDELAIVFLDTDKDTHFTGGIALNAMETESVAFPADWGKTNIDECIIESVVVQADQNLEWDIFIWSKAEFDNTDLDLDKFTDYINFPVTSGKRIAGANQYYYASPANNVKIPYRDQDRTQKIHIGLVNRSATAKNAGATGEIKLRLGIRPVYGV